MKKQLSEMTREELGKLFPIFLTEDNKDWKSLFREESQKITNMLEDEGIIKIEHIGSTAIKEIMAKPTIDMIIFTIEDIDKNKIVKKLTSIGYNYIPRPDNPPPHMMFVKGYTPDGFKGQAYHLHFRLLKFRDEIIFRNYLNANPKIRNEYELLKIELSQKYKNDREAYTEGKTKFVNRVLSRAKETTDE